jgi:type II secretory pathway component PulF
MSFGLFMMGGMIAGAIGGAIKNNSSENIDDACSAFNKANQELEKTLKHWEKITKDEALLEASAAELGETLTKNADFYNEKKNQIHDAFREQEIITMATIGVFIFIIIIALLIKYFNIYENIWNLIVGKK